MALRMVQAGAYRLGKDYCWQFVSAARGSQDPLGAGFKSVEVSAQFHRVHLPQRSYSALTDAGCAPADQPQFLPSSSYTAQAANLFPVVLILYF